MDYLTGDSFGVILTPETCYQIYLNHMSQVKEQIKNPQCLRPGIKLGFRTMNELINQPIDPIDCYYASLSLTVKDKIKVMIKVCEEKKKYVAARFMKSLIKDFCGYVFDRAIKFEADLGIPLTEYISFIEYQYSLAINLDGDMMNFLTVMMDMIDKEILLIGDEESMTIGCSSILILKYEDSKMRIVPFAAR